MTNDMIYITGGRGFIGQWVIRSLIELGVSHHNIRTIDDATRPSPSVTQQRLLDQYCGWGPQYPTVINHNFSVASGALATLFSTLPPRTIIHLAGPSNQHQYDRSPLSSSITMVGGLTNMLQYATIHPVERFVFVSSSMVYQDWTDATPITEEHPTNPLRPYAILKHAGERLVLDWAQRTGRTAIVIRPQAVYGPHDRLDRVMTKFCQLALTGKDITVHGPEQVLDFTWVGDVATAIARAATVATSAIQHHTYNVSRNEPQPHTLLELANMIVEQTGSSSKILTQPHDTTYPQRGRQDTSRAQCDFDWRAHVDLECGLETTLNWLRDLNSL